MPGDQNPQPLNPVDQAKFIEAVFHEKGQQAALQALQRDIEDFHKQPGAGVDMINNTRQYVAGLYQQLRTDGILPKLQLGEFGARGPSPTDTVSSHVAPEADGRQSAAPPADGRYQNDNGTFTTYQTGLIQRTESRDGRLVRNFSYTNQGQLDQVAGSNNQTFTLGNDGRWRDNSGQVFANFGPDPVGNLYAALNDQLVKVFNADGSTVTRQGPLITEVAYPDGQDEVFVYTGNDLSAVTDKDGNGYARQQPGGAFYKMQNRQPTAETVDQIQVLPNGDCQITNRGHVTIIHTDGSRTEQS